MKEHLDRMREEMARIAKDLEARTAAAAELAKQAEALRSREK